MNKGIQVGAGVIDRDYEGELKVVLFNSGKEDYVIHKGDRIAQIVVQTIMGSSCSNILQQTSRESSGFGSTDGDKINNVHSSVDTDLDYDDLILIDSPYDKKLQLKIRNRRLHPTRGLEIVKDNERLLLKSCIKSTPAARIPCWRGTLRDAIIESIDGVQVQSIQEVENLIQNNKSKYSLLVLFQD